MSQKRKSKEEIVAEYLTGNYTYRELGLKYDIPFRSICGWVLEYQGRKPTHREKMQRQRTKEGQAKEIELSNEVKILQSELRKQQLHNKLLEEVIRIGGIQTGIDWKKKFGTRQS